MSEVAITPLDRRSAVDELAAALRRADPGCSLDSIADRLLREMRRQHADSLDDVALVLLSLDAVPSEQDHRGT